PQPLSIIRKDLEKSLENEAFFSHVLIININGKKEKAILKDLQRHPARNSVTHADFMRVSEKVAIKVHVPIHFLNEKTCHGVKVQGGMIQHQATDIEVLCLPSDIPEFIEVDMAEVKTGDIIHLSDIALPSGVTSVALSLGEDHDLAVASVVAPKGGSDAEEGSSEDSSSDSSSED
ncbi:MAG TPA: 50S ribosomal protein L25, partial [Haliea salexigens]|nr:50S ribosomal protein L25 [Haliea salexigens]